MTNFDVHLNVLAENVDVSVQDEDFKRRVVEEDYDDLDNLWVAHVLAPASLGYLGQMKTIANIYNKEFDESNDDPEMFMYDIYDDEIQLAVEITNEMEKELPEGVIVRVGFWEEGCYCVMLGRDI